MAEREKSTEVLSLFVYDQIRARIVDGRLAAGEPLRERDLAAELGVSRVPIREALPALERAGFVQVLPRRSAVVTRITERDVNDLYDLRSVLEPLVARGAAAMATAGAATDELDAALAAAGTALHEQDFAAFTANNARFHRAIEALAGNQLMITTMMPLRDRSDRLNVVTLDSNPTHRHQEHVSLLEAIHLGSADLASAVAFSHVELGRRRTIATLSAVPGFIG